VSELRLTKKHLTILERVFSNEICSEFPLQLRASKALTDLITDGMLQSVSVVLPGRFPVTVRGVQLTTRGHVTYCQWAAKQHETTT
jgi:hypothetical protein